MVKGATGHLEEGGATPGLRASPNRNRNGSRSLLRPGSSEVSKGPASSLDGATATAEQTTSLTASPGALVKTAGSVRNREKPKEIILDLFNQVYDPMPLDFILLESIVSMVGKLSEYLGTIT